MATQREHYDAASNQVMLLNQEASSGTASYELKLIVAELNIKLAMVPASVTEDRSEDYRPD